MNKIVIIKILLSCVVFFSMGVVAQDSENNTNEFLPDYYPEYFDNAALLTEIDKDNKQLVFGLVRITYDANVQVSTLASQFGTIDSISAGDRIGFSAKNSNGQIKIIKIWQLPEDQFTIQ